VESRDVSTQTDRSDYMLIKQRQQEKQKQLIALLAQKNDAKQSNAEENQSPDPNHATPAAATSLSGMGNQSQAANQNKFRNEIKSLLNSSSAGAKNAEINE